MAYFFLSNIRVSRLTESFHRYFLSTAVTEYPSSTVAHSRLDVGGGAYSDAVDVNSNILSVLVSPKKKMNQRKQRERMERVLNIWGFCKRGGLWWVERDNEEEGMGVGLLQMRRRQR